MDIDNLHNTILQSYSNDSNAVSGLEQINQTESRWTREEDGLLRLDGRIFVPNVSDLRLQVLHYFHDHSLAGHFRQNQTLELIRQQYTWPRIREFVRDYICSCTVCGRNKPR